MIAHTLPQVRLSSKTMLLDGVTPIAAYAALRAARPGPSFLLESAPGAGQLARHSIIGLGILGEVVAADGEVTLSIDGEMRFMTSQVQDAARLLLRAHTPVNLDPAVAPFVGAYGVAASEFAGYLERLPRLPRSADCIPDLHLIVPKTIVVFDHFTHRAVLITLGDGAESGDGLEAVLQDARIAPLAAGSKPLHLRAVKGALSYTEMVGQAKAAIAAGDIFQIVLSQSWTAALSVDPLSAYRTLRSINQSPYMFYLELGRGTLFGSSPELLCKLEGRRARQRPLAGTRPRPAQAQAQSAMAAQLRSDPKERAEHIMLVDLARNDLGRVCEYGSVCVTELLDIEHFSHVMHLVSEVTGTLRDDCDAIDLFAASFPAGTVSGAPKIRAMELTAQLEGRRRGYYGGSVARFGFDGSLDACITLRSAFVRDGVAHVAAGAGIVADSLAASEDAECQAKARAVLEALQAASVAPS